MNFISDLNDVDNQSEVDFEDKPLLGYEQSEEHHGNATVSQAVFNIVCMIAGVGVLNLPFALKETGWFGIGVFVSAALVNYYTGHLLHKTLDSQRDNNVVSFRQIGQAAFGFWGATIVEFFHKTTLLGVCTLFLILSGNLVYSVLESSVPGLTITWATLACGVILLIPAVTIKSMRESSWLGFFGMMSTVIVVFIILILALLDQQNQPKANTRLIGTSFASSSAAIAFSFSGNTVYPEIMRSMKNPKKFNLSLGISMLIVTATYILTASVGYAVYGENVQSPILLSLPKGAITIIANILMILHVLMAYPVAFSAISIELESTFRIRKLAVKLPLRSFIWGITIVMAIAIPNFPLFMSLSSALTNTALVFILPVIFYLKLHDNLHFTEYLLGGIVILLGLVIGIYGGIEAIMELIN